MITVTKPSINKLGYNTIPEQRLTYANQLSVRDWNLIINSLRAQTNGVVDYLRQLHGWLSIPDANLDALISGNLITNISYDIDSRLLTVNYLNGTPKTIETGSVNIYYDDNLPEDTTKIKPGDLWLSEESPSTPVDPTPVNPNAGETLDPTPVAPTGGITYTVVGNKYSFTIEVVNNNNFACKAYYSVDGISSGMPTTIVSKTLLETIIANSTYGPMIQIPITSLATPFLYTLYLENAEDSTKTSYVTFYF